MTLSPALARTLAAGRPQFNARVSAMRRARTGFDSDALAEAIRRRLDPVVVAVDRVAPDRTSAMVEAGFDLILTLAAQGMAGRRRALTDRVWREAAVAYAAIVAERPFATLAMLTNAALTIETMPGANADAWVDRMVVIAPLVAADTLAAAGQVAAWRSGMAHYRDGALTTADGLSEALALAAIGATGSWTEVRAALVADPWWRPDNVVCEGISFGGFAGFGGPFSEPPRVRAGGQGFFVQSGDRTGLLVADAWGATLHPAVREEFDAAAESGARIDGAVVAAGDRRITLDLPPEGLSVAVTATSIAIASRYSHVVRVLPWTLS
ncbi:hypothetical protein [Sphingomonas alpina]|uniref:Uncharacterized protein n=1 Tax=Sphingomonas alpina TaxID=653931 RepID=A0A7H0LFR3_9SPHN|nr:hypothetical protein [Sphingomonas alpina]QNQ08516.1 hypothetical protein H3Z74_17445 [Sphingomonas alpina]